MTLAAVVAVALLMVQRGEAQAPFATPLRISSGTQQATGTPSVNVDFIEHIYAAWIEGDRVWSMVDANFPGVLLPASNANTLQPLNCHVHRENSNVSTVVFERLSGLGGDSEIFYTTNLGGGFSAPFNLSQSLLEDTVPHMAGAIGGGEIHTVWQRDAGGPNPLIMLNVGIPGTEINVGVGQRPRVAAHLGGDYHIVFLRDAGVFYLFGNSGGSDSEQMLSPNAAVATSAEIVVDESNVAHVVYCSGGDIFYRRGSAGVFSPATNLSVSAGTAATPAIAIEGDILHVVYTESGDLMHVISQGGNNSVPMNITNSGSVESAPDVAVDRFAGLHLVFQRDSEIYYTTNSPLPVPAFTTDVTVGEAPLEVNFTDTSRGGGLMAEWDFGDGNIGFGNDTTHTYQETGSYDVTLTSIGPAGDVTELFVGAIVVTEPSTLMRIPPVLGVQGELNLNVPVMGDFVEAVRGYQISLTWNKTDLTLTASTLQTTPANLLDPDFAVAELVDNGSENYFTLAVVFEVAPPFDNLELPAGVDQRLVNLAFDVDPLAAPVTSVELAHGFGVVPIVNAFIDASGATVVPALSNTPVELLVAATPLVPFLRGDTNNSSQLDISDAISLLNYLFLAGTSPECFDAADTNDSGSITLSDAIFGLNTLFGGGGTIPAPPYPQAGFDPTPDNLPDCQ